MPQGQDDKSLIARVSQLLKDAWLPPVSSRTKEAVQIQALLCPLTTTPGAININMDTVMRMQV
jgi:hypothetical protein